MTRSVLVTGSSRGIGRAIALQLATQGFDVVLHCRSQRASAEQVREQIAGQGQSGRILQFDIADRQVAGEGIAADIEAHGAYYGVVCNAGVTADNAFPSISPEQWDRVISVNLKSCFNLTKAVMRTMLKARSGSIVNISSVVGVQGNAGQANYAASKAGILGFTKSVALELGSRNIRCNAIAPGFIETEMTAKLDADTVQGWRDAIPLKRGGTPEDVANLCVFLASDMSAYITGQTLNVDGGMITA